MHELSYAQALLDEVLRLADENDAKRIVKIHLQIGELLLINPEQLKFCFSAISKGTIAEDAELVIEFIKPKIVCTECGREFDEVIGICDCGGIVSIEGGKDFLLKKIEMEVE